MQAEILLPLAPTIRFETDWRRAAGARASSSRRRSEAVDLPLRRADVTLYEGVKRQLVAAGAGVAHLTVSFRSVPALQTAVNAAFALCMNGADGQASYVPLEPSRADVPQQPALVALPVPRPYGDFGKVVHWKIEESLPEAIAAFVDWMVMQSGWKVTERERPDQPVDVAARHV